jgi:hypothetical protein
MDYGDEIKLEMKINNTVYAYEYEQAVQENKWIDVDGRHLDISGMGMQHIANCIKLCRTKPNWRPDMLRLLLIEYNKRRIPNK